LARRNSDPQNAVDLVRDLYGDGAFLDALFHALSDTGILLTQVGEAVWMGSPSEDVPGNVNYRRYRYEQALLERGYGGLIEYSVMHTGFDDYRWSFLAAFKDPAAIADDGRWYRNAAHVDLDVRKRSVETRDGRSPFDYFDGPAMTTWAHPQRASRVVRCRRRTGPVEGCVDGRPVSDDGTVPSSSFLPPIPLLFPSPLTRRLMDTVRDPMHHHHHDERGWNASRASVTTCSMEVH
jgi:hypothetical protein